MLESNDFRYSPCCDKGAFKIVDLQAGPKNGEGRDAKYFHSWAGHNTERGTIMFLSGAMGVLTLIVVGGLAIAKLDMTFQMAIRIFFLPFIFVIGLLPSGSQKTWQYLGDILGLLMKRIFVVLILIVSLNILKFKYTKILRRFYDKRKTKRDCF